MKLEVHCYSGRKADERLVFDWTGINTSSRKSSTSGMALKTPFTKFVDDGNLYILRRETTRNRVESSSNE